MKRIFILVCILSLFLLGCNSNHPEGWKSGNLEDYITNYNEVEDALKEVFNTFTVSIKQSDSTCSDIDTLSNFGNGNFYIISNNIEFQVICKNKIASVLSYNNGSSRTIAYTKTEKDRLNQDNKGLIGLGNDIVNLITDKGTNALNEALD